MFRLMRPHRGSVHIVILVLLVVALIGGVGAVFWHRYSQRTASPSIQKPSAMADTPKVPTGTVTPSSDSIWAGYSAYGQTFSSVEGKITVPQVSCLSSQDTFAAWVGFDGYGNGTVEQAGFTADCRDDSAFAHDPPINGVTYYGWSMMYGAGGSDTFDLSIHPGDVIFYQVKYASDKFVMTVRNETRNMTKTISYVCQVGDNSYDQDKEHPCPRQTAEWIVERPGDSPMAKFSPATLYDNKAVGADGKSYSLNSFDTNRLDMTSSSGVPLAKTSAILNGNDTFTVEWKGEGTVGE